MHALARLDDNRIRSADQHVLTELPGVVQVEVDVRDVADLLLAELIAVSLPVEIAAAASASARLPDLPIRPFLT